MHRQLFTVPQWKVFVVSLALVFLALDFWAIAYSERSLVPSKSGRYGVEFGPVEGDLSYRLTKIAPESPLVALGAKVGDRVTFDRQADRSRRLGVGESIGLTILGKGEARHVVIEAIPRQEIDAQAKARYLLFMANALFSTLLALLIGLRRPETTAVRALVITLLMFSSSFSRSGLPLNPFSEFLATAGLPLFVFFMLVCFVRFAISFPHEDPAHRKWLVRYVFPAYALALAGYTVLVIARNQGWLPLELASAIDFDYLIQLIGILSIAGALISLWFTWKASSGLVRQRVAWIGLCMGIVFATVLGGSLNLVLGAPIAMPTYGFWQSIINFLALLGLGYALLRHRVFDFGFAVNRALVFGIASAILLLAFFSLEKLAEYFLHVEGREQNALLDGAIALGVFLFFHRVRHGVEHYLERLLFSQWHNNEKALRHFVKQAAHITQSDALLTALTTEFDRFTAGAGNATYRRNADGHFERAAGTLEGAPEILDANDPLVVALRADHQPTRCEDTRSSLPAEIALPMSHRAELDGFILVGGKLNKENYRPDEIELLNFAANQVGLDLHALEAEEFKREVAEHERKASELAREAAVLRSNNEDMRALVERALAAQSKA